jgi:flagellar biosynthesis protein FliQ
LILDPSKSTSDSGPVEGTPAGHRAGIHLLPRTRLGFWAVRLLIAFAALFLTICTLVATGQRGIWLLSLVIPLFLCGVLAGATAAVAIVRRGERSVLVFLPLIVGILIAIFLLGELVGPE